VSVDQGMAGSIGDASPLSPGDALRAARERAGLTQDDIAGKLKLSPRQISAIETGDWSALPERTFTRGFMRSYARLVGVDPDSLGLDQSSSQPHAASELKPTPEAIGEIAHEADRNAFPAARLVVPALLIAALAGGVLYFQGHQWFGWDLGKVASAPTKQDLKAAVAAKAEAASAAAKTEAAATSSGTVIAPAPTTTSEPAPATTTANPTSASATDTAALPGAVPAAAAAAATTSPTIAAPLFAPGDKRISLTFKGKSWTEVRSKGEVIFSETAQPGTREFSGAAPLSFIVGNASNVVVTIDGKTFDMSDLTRNDVARFRVE
jgi:cytoskeleton protein RodZ